MAKAKLTDRGIQAIKPVEGKRIELHDEQVPGLVLRITSAGKRTWSMVYRRRSDGLKRRMTLGPYPSITLERARRKAHEVVAAVWDGKDPVGEVKALDARITFADLASRYLERHVRRKLRSAKEIELRLNKHILPEWRHRAAADIQKSDVIALLDGVADKGHGTLANRLRGLIGALFNWAIAEDILSSNPAAGIRNRVDEATRERFLDEAEIKTFLAGLDRGAMPADVSAVLQLCLLTGQRVGELAGLAVQEIDARTWIWTLPSDRSKNGQAHVIPLVGEAKALVKDWVEKAHRAKRPNLFEAAGGTPLKANHVGTAMIRRRDQLGVAEFTAHDLRRTFATQLSAMGIDRLTIGSVLNHLSTTKAGVTGSVYDRNDRLDEKRRALEAWDAEVRRIVEGKPTAENVVQLRG